MGGDTIPYGELFVAILTTKAISNVYLYGSGTVVVKRVERMVVVKRVERMVVVKRVETVYYDNM